MAKYKNDSTRVQDEVDKALKRAGTSPYLGRVVFRTNVIVLLYLVAAWFLDRLSWPLAGGVFVYWLLLPFVVVWSWPANSKGPVWRRTIIAAPAVALASGIAIALLG